MNQNQELSSPTQPTNGGLGTLQPRELPQPPLQNDNTMYIGRFSYEARTAEDLSFEKGERLKVIGGTEGDWWMAKSMRTGREGYIPRNYVASLTSFDAEE